MCVYKINTYLVLICLPNIYFIVCFLLAGVFLLYPSTYRCHILLALNARTSVLFTKCLVQNLERNLSNCSGIILARSIGIFFALSVFMRKQRSCIVLIQFI